jgi:hypothetical protein
LSLAGARHEISAPCVSGGATDGEGFLTYVESIPVPSLSEGDLGIMDNPPGVDPIEPIAAQNSSRALGSQQF